MVPARAAAGGESGARPGRGYRVIHSRRRRNSKCYRTSGIRRARAASSNLQAPQTGACRPRRSGEALMSASVQEPTLQVSAPLSQLAVAYSVCRGITRSAAKNFYYAFLVLPRRKREALCAVYAFMRRCDDIADDAMLPVRERKNKLETCLESLHRALAGEATDDAVLLALTDAQRRYRIAPELLEQLAYGTMMDVQES